MHGKSIPEQVFQIVLDDMKLPHKERLAVMKFKDDDALFEGEISPKSIDTTIGLFLKYHAGLQDGETKEYLRRLRISEKDFDPYEFGRICTIFYDVYTEATKDK